MFNKKIFVQTALSVWLGGLAVLVGTDIAISLLNSTTTNKPREQKPRPQIQRQIQYEATPQIPETPKPQRKKDLDYLDPNEMEITPSKNEYAKELYQRYLIERLTFGETRI